jgi:hypothetical protein
VEQAPHCSYQAVLELALKEPELSPRELAVSFVDRQQYFVSEASVYRLLKANDLITSPAFILMKAGDSFAHPTTASNQLWQAGSNLPNFGALSQFIRISLTRLGRGAPRFTPA